MKEKIKHFVKKYWNLIVITICVLSFIGILIDVINNDTIERDIISYNFIATHFMSDNMTTIALSITNLGGTTFVILLAIILAILIKNKKISLFILLNLVISTILNILLKNILQRPRPTEYRIIEESGYSFPSGHSMIGMAFYGFLIYLIYENIENKYIRWTLIVFLALVIISIGISRVYLGVHYLSDVLAGFLISIIYLFIFINIFKKII